MAKTLIVRTATNVLGMRTKDEYRRYFEHRVKQDRLTERRVDTPVAARIDAGRWVADCECNAGMSVNPAWDVGYCILCGRVYTVLFPDDVAAVESTVIGKSQYDAFWTAEVDHGTG